MNELEQNTCDSSYTVLLCIGIHLIPDEVSCKLLRCGDFPHYMHVNNNLSITYKSMLAYGSSVLSCEPSFNDRSITRLRIGEKRNLSLPVGVLLYNAKVLFRDIKICKLILCKAETLLFLLKVISFSFLNRIVACMLSMAKGIKVGSELRVLRGKFSTQKGVVQASEGVGRARKWIVKLNGGVLERFSARTLELEQRHLITPPSKWR